MLQAPPRAAFFLGSAMEHWFGLQLKGLNADDLDKLHGFSPGLELAWSDSATIGVTDSKTDHRNSTVLQTDLIRAELRPDCAAQLRCLTDNPLVLSTNRSQFKPLFAALSQQWLRLGQLALHGAVLRLGAQQVLVLGESHSGKSTLTTAALKHQAEVVSDDYVLLRDASQRYAQRLRGFLRIRTDAGEKHYIIPKSHALFPEQLQLDAVLLLKAGERQVQSQLFAVSPLQVMSEALQQSAAFFMRPEFPVERDQLIRLTRAISQLPALGMLGGFDVVTDFPNFIKRLDEAFAAL
jgi:hypothetical protein